MATRTTPLSPPVAALGLAAGALVLALAALSATTPVEAESVDLRVPYHGQEETWYCAEASLQMVFDYWGEEIPQHDIGDVANERRVGGTYASDLVRAAHFSNRSTAVQPREGGGEALQGYEQRPYGYGAFTKQWGDDREGGRAQLMDLVREGYPVIVLCWLDESRTISHYRVLKGFDTEANDLVFHDPALGANKRFDMDVFVDDLWAYYDRWALAVVPWSLELETPGMMGPDATLEVRVNVSYDCPSLFIGTQPSTAWPQEARATVTVGPPFALAPSEEPTKVLGIHRAGDSNWTSWRVTSPGTEGLWEGNVTVLAGALVSGRSITHGWYTDLIGTAAVAVVTCDASPPALDLLEVVGGPTFGDHGVTVAYSASDLGSGVQEVAFSWDGGASWTAFGGPEGEVTLDLVGVEGPCTIEARVVDGLSNTGTASLEVVIDTEPPTISLFQLAGGEAIVTQRLLMVDLEASDRIHAVELMAIRVGRTPWGAWQPYEARFQVELGSDGDHTLSVRVRDTMGHVAAASAEVTLDTTPPYITAFQAAEGLHFVANRTVGVTVGATDNLDGDIEVDLREVGGLGPGRRVLLASGSTVRLEWTFASEGERTLVLVVRDRALHTAEATATLVVDTLPPAVSLILNGGKGTATSPRIPVALSAIDATTDVKSSRVRIDENAWGPWRDPSLFRDLDLGPVMGRRTVHAQVQDTAGNVAGTSATIHLDYIGPRAHVNFTRLVPGGLVHEGSSFIVTFTEPMDVGSTEVVLLDNSSGRLECDVEWQEHGLEMNVTPARPLPRGTSFSLSVQGRDLYGNELEFRGAFFSTPEAEDDGWDMSITGDSAVLLLLLVLVLAATGALGWGLVRGRR